MSHHVERVTIVYQINYHQQQTIPIENKQPVTAPSEPTQTDQPQSVPIRIDPTELTPTEQPPSEPTQTPEPKAIIPPLPKDTNCPFSRARDYNVHPVVIAGKPGFDKVSTQHNTTSQHYTAPQHHTIQHNTTHSTVPQHYKHNATQHGTAQQTQFTTPNFNSLVSQVAKCDVPCTGGYLGYADAQAIGRECQHTKSFFFTQENVGVGRTYTIVKKRWRVCETMWCDVS